MMAVIYLDRQHSGKPGRKARDRGAIADLDGDGKREVDEAEAMLTPRYLLACESRLIEYGYTVVPISDGWYSARHDRVNEYARGYSASTQQVYIAAHLNAGGGHYGLILYDYRSRSGPELAKHIAKHLEQVAPEVAPVLLKEAKPEGWTRHAYATISGVAAPVALCFEPAFIDSDKHRELLASGVGLASIGYALAEGIHRWLASR